MDNLTNIHTAPLDASANSASDLRNGADLSNSAETLRKAAIPKPRSSPRKTFDDLIAPAMARLDLGGDQAANMKLLAAILESNAGESAIRSLIVKTLGAEPAKDDDLSVYSLTLGERADFLQMLAALPEQLKPTSAADLMRQQAERLQGELTLIHGDTETVELYDWLWEGHYLRGKFHLLAAKPETGKNLISISIAAILSRGGLWPDGTQAPVGDTLIWSGEDFFNDTTLPRFLAAGGVRSRIHATGAMTDGITGERRDFDPARDVPALMRKIDEIPDLLYVIIDPVSVIVSAGRGASNNNAEARRALTILVNLARDRKIVVEGITHLTKESGKRALLERVIESTAFGAVARMVHMAHKFADLQKPRLWGRAKSNTVPAGESLGYEYQIDDAYIEVPEHPGVKIKMPRLVWRAPILTSFEALIADDAAPGELSVLDTAKQWLQQTLTEAPSQQLSVKEIEGAAHAHGISAATLKRAREALPIRAHPNQGATGGAGWNWRWLAEPEAAALPIASREPVKLRGFSECPGLGEPVAPWVPW